MKQEVGVLSFLVMRAAALSADVGLFGFSRLNTTNLIPEWLPICFEAENLVSFSECLADFVPTVCDFDASNTFITISSCASDVDFLDPMLYSNSDASLIAADDISSFSNDLRVCLDPLVPCINKTIESLIETVLEPTCLPAKLSNLTECARQNGVACQASCEDALVTATEGGNPWLSLDESSLSTCNGIQSELLDPFCEVVTCCEPCVQHYKELMECLVNDILNYTGEVCGFECTHPAGRRHLRSSSYKPYHEYLVPTLEQVDLSCLRYSPGLTPDLTGTRAGELALRAPYFLPCVATQFAAEIGSATGYHSP